MNRGPISATSVLQLVLMEPRFHWFSLVHKNKNCSTSVRWSLYKQLFHMKRMRKHRGDPANACFILKLFWGRFSETRLKTLVENKWWLLQHFCSCLYLFHREPLEVLLFLRLCLRKQRPLQSLPSLAKSLIASCFDFTFQLLVPSSAVTCLGPWLKAMTDSWGVFFPFGDSQLC